MASQFGKRGCYMDSMVRIGRVGGSFTRLESESRILQYIPWSLRMAVADIRSIGSTGFPLLDTA